MEILRQLMLFIRYVGVIFANKAHLKAETQHTLLLNYLWMKLLGLTPVYIQQKIRHIPLMGHHLNVFDLRTTISIFESIFIENEYYFVSKNKNPLIIDLGSNIGLSIVYFKTLFPNCSITAFEADPVTFSILSLNINNYQFKNVTLINKAVTSKKGKVEFYIDKNGPGSPLMSTNKHRLPKNKIVVPSTKLSDIITKKVEYIKMDIEGSETEVMKEINESGKIDMVSQMSIEYHHHIDKNEDTLSNFLLVLEKNGFGYQIHASQNTPFELKTFEDIQIHAYRK